jgi:hypothetical protein
MLYEEEYVYVAQCATAFLPERLHAAQESASSLK